MPLESGTYISDLVATNPAITDQVSQGDDHIRLLKSVLKNTFPNIDGAVTITDEQLNSLAADLSTKAPIDAPTFTGEARSVTAPDGDNSTRIATTEFVITNGVPSGGILMWSGSINTIPGGFAICDGQNGTPDLRNRFVVGAGSTYAVAATGGSNTVTPTTNSAGGHDHGGSTGSHALTESQMPKHYHEYVAPGSITSPQGGTSGYGVFGGGTPDDGALRTGTWSTGGGASSGGTSTGTGNGTGHSHSMSTDGSHNHSVTVDTRSPYYALAYIMKL